MSTRLPNFSVKIPYNIILSTVEKLQNLCGGQCITNLGLGRGRLLPSGNVLLICYCGDYYVYPETTDTTDWSFGWYPIIPKEEFLRIINFIEENE